MEIEEYVSNERIGQYHKKRANEIEISNVPNRKFKEMVIKILTGHEKRMEDHSKTLNKEIEKHKKESISYDELNH